MVKVKRKEIKKKLLSPIQEKNIVTPSVQSPEEVAMITSSESQQVGMSSKSQPPPVKSLTTPSVLKKRQYVSMSKIPIKKKNFHQHNFHYKNL